MNDVDGDFYPSGQGTTTPAVPPVSRESPARSHGEKLKVMNPTPNGYSNVPNHKSSKSDGSESIKKESGKSNSEHRHSSSSRHSSDHVKKKDSDSSKNKTSSSPSKSKDSSSSKDNHIKSDVSKSKDHHKDKKHQSKDGSKPKESKHSDHKEGKLKGDETVKKDHHSTDGKSKSDNFKENEKVKDGDGKSKDTKDKHKDIKKEKSSDKHKEKHKDKTEKSKESSSDKNKEKHKDKLKEKTHSSDLDVSKSSSPTKSRDSASPVKKVKQEILSDDEMPLASRKTKPSKSIKREIEDDDEEDEPLATRMEKVKKVKTEKPAKRKKVESEDDEYSEREYKKPAKKIKKEKKVQIKEEVTTSPKKKGKKEDDQDVWKWWEEEKLDDGVKWKTLEHQGPVFAPPYERVPKGVKLLYDGKPLELSELTEEVAGFYGRMLDHDYTTKDVFNTNFFKDWRKVMTPKEKEIITDLRKCNFNAFNDYYKMKSEERKSMTKEQKQEIKKENEAMTAKYGFCIIDGHKQKIGNFRLEPPGLFRGRGEHPKMGMLKRRVQAEDILINIGKQAKAPEPPAGHKWKEVRHDNTVSWLASWAENILGSTKYIMLNPSSKLKGEKDWQKYETARKLKQHAGRIRAEYSRDFKSKEMKVRQRAVALYFIDKLALRAGNEKDEDTADTVGCCSLRVEHITLDDEKDGQEFVVSFDFLGKDSIRYENSVAVEKRAYKNLKLFMENKQPGDDLFDRLNTSILNKYLNDLMEGLTAKVFRTYNASKTLQEQLDLLTKEEMSLPEKLLAYNRANRAVAILCNHQRAVPKGFSKSMETLKQKMDDKIKQISEFKRDLKDAKRAAKGSEKEKMIYEKKRKRLQQLEEQLKKLEVQATDKEENKQIALGTSKLNYLDPRISVAWCKKWDVPIEKIYNRTQRDKFRWAIEMAGPEYKF